MTNHDSDINECVVNATTACPANSDCINTNGSYYCNCSKGYSGDGYNCTGTGDHSLWRFLTEDISGYHRFPNNYHSYTAM